MLAKLLRWLFPPRPLRLYRCNVCKELSPWPEIEDCCWEETENN